MTIQIHDQKKLVLVSGKYSLIPDQKEVENLTNLNVDATQ